MRVHPAFTPSAVSAEQLDALTVGRHALFATLVERITGAARDGARPHTLLVAPRGGGKTHTLHVVVNRAVAARDVADRLLPVLLPEDALAIGSYPDLLVEVARAIGDDVGRAARASRRDRDVVGMEQSIMAAAGDRMILLAIENLDRVFDNLGQSGQGSLRAWVETSTAIMVLATTPALFAGVSSRSHPWYGSFMVETLPEFTVDEGASMLGRAAHRRGDDELRAFVDTAAGVERMQVIHRLAGGSPRLWQILSEFVDVQSLDALVPAIEALLDRVTPYYQQRLWQLPSGEQRLVVELARGWGPRTVNDLAVAVGVSNQSAATALGRLASSRWVTSSKARDGDKRASWYDLTEPLLRYQVQYREQRGKPLRLLVEFLRGFYSRDRLFVEFAEATPNSVLERQLLVDSGPGAAETALAALNEIIDDLSEHETMHAAEVGPWTSWATAAVRTDAIPSRRAPHARAAAIGIVLAVKNDDADWGDVRRLVESIVPNDRDDVVARIILTAAQLDLRPPDGLDPLELASGEFQALVRRLESRLRSENGVGVPSQP